MDPAKLKVVELRAELSKRGLDSKGNKPVLVERLRQALEEEKAEPKTHTETTEKPEQSDSEDEGNNSESKSPEPAKLPPRTPSRSSRHASREPTTPARTPTRRSSSRSSLSRQSPAKTTIGENLNETVLALEPIIEEDKSSPKKDDVELTPKKETLLSMPIKEDILPVTPTTTSKKETILLTPTTDVVPETISPITTKEITVSPKTENILKNETLKVQKVEQLDIVKEAEKHVPDKSQEITRKSVDDVYKINAQSLMKSTDQCLIKPVTQSSDKLMAQSPTKSMEQSPVKLASPSPTKVPIQSPIKPIADSSDKHTDNENPIESTIQSPIKASTESPVKSFVQILTTSAVQSPVKIDTLNPVKFVSQSPIKYGVQGEQSSMKDEVESLNKKNDADETEKNVVTQESMNKTEDTIKSMDESMDQVNDAESMKTDEQGDKLEKSDDKSDDRKRKRSPSPREETPRAPPIARPENEPTFDDNTVLLSWYDSDLNLVIDTTQYFSASPMQGDGFNYMWAGVRTSYGFTKGKIFYEARVNSRFDNAVTPVPPASNSANTSGAIPADEEKIPSALRLGWSTLGTSLQLGEEKLSYGYDSTGKKSTNNEFIEYGKTFAKDDVVGCYADFETDGHVTLTYTVNGESQGPAFVLKKEDLENKALFPHVLSKNCSFTVNLGQEEYWNDNILNGYVSVGKIDLRDRIAGPRRPEKREDCEVILLCGLPFSGKTSWARKHAAEYPEKYYSILGTHNLIEKMTVDGVPLKESYKGRWETVVDKCSRALTKLLDSAPSRRRNYILDQQANVYGSTQKRKTRNFYGFHRKAVVLVPKDEEFKARIAKRKEEPDGEEIRESSILEVKANFSAPTVGDSFEEVIWGELNEEEGRKLIEAYNMEGKSAGYGQSLQQPNKRSRFDNGQKDRNNRDNRGHRRSGYNERRNSGAWRGGGSGGSSSSSGGGGGWRDGGRMRGGPMRHGAGYGLPSVWRGRGGLPLQRSGVNDRRQGNERNRPSGAHRPIGWNAMGYQGNQHGSSSGVWSNQSSWQGQSQGSWSGQQGTPSAWSQQQQQAWSGNSWKSYGQNSYGQSAGGSYGQQTGSGYGNGNWNNWGPQYYNQYWGGSGQQQQQTGGQTPTTAGSGGGGGGGQSISKK